VLLGRKATHLERGHADTGAPTGWRANEFIERSNSGHFSASSHTRELPLAGADPGAQITDWLNLFEAARAKGGGASWYANPCCYATVVIAAFDGMLLRLGHMTDESNMCNVGSLNHKVDVAEAEKLLDMNDEELRDWDRVSVHRKPRDLGVYFSAHRLSRAFEPRLFTFVQKS